VRATPDSIDRIKKEELIKFIKYSLTGVMNTAVDFGVFALLTWLGLGMYISQVISYSAGILNSYIVNRSWTFKTTRGFYPHRFSSFLW
jgi:putative flippase GtrA